MASRLLNDLELGSPLFSSSDAYAGGFAASPFFAAVALDDAPGEQDAALAAGLADGSPLMGFAVAMGIQGAVALGAYWLWHLWRG